jgi:hypothetical protein
MSIKNQLTIWLVLTKRAILNQRTYRIQPNTYPPTLYKPGRKTTYFRKAFFSATINGVSVHQASYSFSNIIDYKRN